MPCAVYDHSCSIYPSDNYSLSVAYISSKCNWVKSMFGRLWLGVSCQATRWSRRTRSHGWMRHLPPSHKRLLLSQSRARTPTAASKGSRPREGWPQQEPTARTRAGHPLRSSRWPRCPGRRHPGTWRWPCLDHEHSETQPELATHWLGAKVPAGRGKDDGCIGSFVPDLWKMCLLLQISH
jgi:hypothetical protein